MQSTDPSGTHTPSAVTAQAEIILHNRYTKDLSFENVAVSLPPNSAPHFDISISVDCRRQEAMHEVALSTTVTATLNDRVVFVVEIVYAGLFELPEMDEAAQEHFLLEEAPRMLFPWVARIAADVVRDGGLPTLSISPPDFAAMRERSRSSA